MCGWGPMSTLPRLGRPCTTMPPSERCQTCHCAAAAVRRRWHGPSGHGGQGRRASHVQPCAVGTPGVLGTVWLMHGCMASLHCCCTGRHAGLPDTVPLQFLLPPAYTLCRWSRPASRGYRSWPQQQAQATAACRRPPARWTSIALSPRQAGSGRQLASSPPAPTPRSR